MVYWEGKHEEYNNKKLVNYNPTININLVSLSRFSDPRPSSSSHLSTRMRSFANSSPSPRWEWSSSGFNQLEDKGERGEGKVFLFFTNATSHDWKYFFGHLNAGTVRLEVQLWSRVHFKVHIHLWVNRNPTYHVKIKSLHSQLSRSDDLRKKKELRHHWAQDRISKEI